jgi:hypothetical protein
MESTEKYTLGHTDAELKRPTTQARLIDPITRRFLLSAGIREGMRVLDVGSGAGDVAILLADLVGHKGERRDRPRAKRNRYRGKANSAGRAGEHCPQAR